MKVGAVTALLLSLAGVALPARAQTRGPVPDAEALARERNSHFLVGVGIEHVGNTLESVGQRILLGPTVAWRASIFEPHLELMFTPFSGRYENLRLRGSLGARTYLTPHRLVELSIGWSLNLEARLQDHFWLASLTPIELGATLYRRGSLRIQLFSGLRAGFAGALIDSFILDPNGFRDSDAQGALDDARLHLPWRLFARIVFERRVN